MAITIEWTPTLFRAVTADTGLEFSSNKRYMRAGSGGHTAATGKTLAGKYVYINASTEGCTWHFNIPGVLERSFIIFGGINHDPGTPAPATQGVKF